MLELETDAANDFLSRGLEPGKLDVEPSGWAVGEHLWNGDLRIRMKPPAGAEAGQEFPILVSLSPKDPPEVPGVLSVEGRLIIDPPTVAPPPPPPPPPKPRVAPPDIREVRHDGWADHGFDERSVASVDKEAGKTIVFVNMDNRGLANYQRTDPRRRDELEEMYKLAVAPIAISLERAVADNEIERDEADKAMSAVGDVVLPSVDFAAKIVQEAA